MMEQQRSVTLKFAFSGEMMLDGRFATYSDLYEAAKCFLEPRTTHAPQFLKGSQVVTAKNWESVVTFDSVNSLDVVLELYMEVDACTLFRTAEHVEELKMEGTETLSLTCPSFEFKRSMDGKKVRWVNKDGDTIRARDGTITVMIQNPYRDYTPKTVKVLYRA